MIPLRRIGSFALQAAAAGAAAVLIRRLLYARHLASLRGCVVIIAGGSRGLGFALARTLTRAGALVSIAGRDPERLERARRALADEGLAVMTYPCDVRDPAAAQELIARSAAQHGPIDVLINVAGVIEVGSVWDQALDDFRESVETHVFGPLHTMRAVLPSMRARGDGRIINISSIGGVIGVPHLAPYCAGKFGLVGLSQAYAAEVAHDGITVTTVCPGLMRTGSPDHAFFKGNHRAEYAWFAISDANPLLSASTGQAVRRIVRAIARRERFAAITPLPRLALVANAVAPATTTRLLELAAHFLPPPTDDQQTRRTGEESHSKLAPSILTELDRLAKLRNNE
ncbi:MAG: SDR family oxidoreductase [Candidatus Eremiobacteraeota bacterium]|nr:SDR family oxidoreductase [Candidatus Eremiobacteraeota bacterium]